MILLGKTNNKMPVLGTIISGSHVPVCCLKPVIPTLHCNTLELFGVEKHQLFECLKNTYIFPSAGTSIRITGGATVEAVQFSLYAMEPPGFL